MHRNGTEDARNPRRSGERDASQPLGGQPRTDDEDDALQLPEQVPSFLTAHELQARDPVERRVAETKPGAMPRGSERRKPMGGAPDEESS